jgi:hypothetical protein
MHIYSMKTTQTMHWFSRHIQQFVYDSDTNHIKIQMYEREFKYLTYNNDHWSNSSEAHTQDWK